MRLIVVAFDNCFLCVIICSLGLVQYTKEIFAEKYIAFSWDAAYELSANDTFQTIHEIQPIILASGSEINGTAHASDLFPTRSQDSVATNYDSVSNNKYRQRIRRAANKDSENDPDDSTDDFQITPELKIKLYTGVILSTIFLIIFVLFIWPFVVCLRSCWRYSTTCCLSCWDLLNCRDPGYRIMCLAAKQNGLEPPTPEEYDRFMTGWEDRAPELLETLMES